MEIAYSISKKLYIRITKYDIKSQININETSEPDINEIVRSVFSHCLAEYDEIIFVPNGEPTNRMEELCSVMRKIRAVNSAIPIRIITSGLGNKINGRDITSELSGLVDVISIYVSENNEYNIEDICEFAKKAGRFIPNVEITVDEKSEEGRIEKCKAIADKCCADFRATQSRMFLY